MLAVVDELDLLAERLDAEDTAYPTPGAIAKLVDPRTVQTPALDVLDAALVDAAEGRFPRLIFTMPPQEGKSMRISRAFPIWLLKRNPDLRIAIVSYADSLSRRWGRLVRNDLIGHPGLGLSLRHDTKAANEWQLEGKDGGMITVGIEGSLTGRPVDVLIIDDPFKDQKQADSETYRENVKEWWRTTGSMRLSEDAIVIVLMTRWHEDDLAGWLLTEEPGDWRHINIPALADHDPAKGETDVLGRQPGEWMISARGRTVRGWLRRKRNAGSRGFQAVLQGRPSPQEGSILKRGWWQFSPTIRAVQQGNGAWLILGNPQVVLQSWDMAFKDNADNDWVVGQVWAKRGSRAWLIDQIRERMDAPTTASAMVTFSAKWPQAKLKLVEEKANGPAVIQMLRGVLPGIVAVNPKDSKEARAHAIAPFVEAGDVELPRPADAPWVAGFVDECASFPNGANDDQVDGCTQALARLFLETSDAADFMNELVNEGSRNDAPQDLGFPFGR